jgi:polar amino acid transport system ATP-binding protein/sulfate transport system ATP-binding protein
MSSAPYEYRETILKLEQVSKSLGGKIILRDFNLEVRNIVRPGMKQGQVIGLLGPSGIGKTTLFHVLAGLQRPDSGSVLIGPGLVPVQRGMVGVVAQNYPLFMHRTVLGNLVVSGRQADLSPADSKAKALTLLKNFGVEDQASKYPAQLSGGQRQRVAIAQQFMCSEHFLLMDEPFSGLDLLAKERICHFITEMAQMDELNTFVIVTHDIATAIEVCDTIVLLGRDRDAEGKPIPGANVQASYNLIERNLAWHENIVNTPEYYALFQEIRAVFPRL